jgi:hypothetical protein
VLEHTPDPESLLRRLASLLKPEGELLLNAPFGAVSFSLPLHLAAHRRLYGRVGLFRRCGLEPVRTRFLWMPIVLRPAAAKPWHIGLPQRAGITLNGWLLILLSLPGVFPVLDMAFHFLNALYVAARRAIARAAGR